MSVGESGHCRAMPAHGHTLTRRPLERFCGLARCCEHGRAEAVAGGT